MNFATMRVEESCVGAYEIAPGVFVGVAAHPEIKHRVAIEALLGWKYHDCPVIVTERTHFVAIGVGLNVTPVRRDPTPTI